MLVVDDNDRIARIVKTRLAALGYHVTTARDGAEALNVVKANKPDLMVLDLIMPGKDGLETLAELRTFSSMPVLVLSGHPDDTVRARALDLGVDDYMPKPFDPDELAHRLKAMLSHSAGKPGIPPPH